MSLHPDIAAVLAGESEGCIITGDCLDVMADMPDGCVDAVVTDPPYFLPAQHYATRKHNIRSMGDLSILGRYFGETWELVCAKTRNEGHLYCFCDGQSYPIFYAALYSRVKALRPLIWDKGRSINGFSWRHQHELILFAELPQARPVRTGDGDILRFRAVPVNDRTHPAEKPLPLIEKLIGKHAAPIILDPFCGSGTICVAARNLNRRWIGIEIDTDYADKARSRVARSNKDH